MLTREQAFTFLQRYGNDSVHKDGVKRDATLVARQLKLMLNGGAYSRVGRWSQRIASLVQLGPMICAKLQARFFLCTCQLGPNGAISRFRMRTAYLSHRIPYGHDGPQMGD